jgi:hypothetical protein
MEVHAVQTKAESRYGWISQYRVSCSLDGSEWEWHPVVLAGNEDNHSLKEIALQPPLVGRLVRLHPVEECGWGVLQAELLGGRCPPRSVADHCLSVMGRMQEDRDFADCWVVCGDRRFECHRVVLAAASPVWRAALKGGYRESREAALSVDDADVPAVEALLKFVYCGDLDASLAADVLPLAHRYDMPGLVSACAWALQRGLARDNAARSIAALNQFLEHERVAAVWPLVLEKVFSDADLQDAALRYVGRRVSK